MKVIKKNGQIQELKCEGCGYTHIDSDNFTFFPKDYEHPLCHGCVERDMFG